MSVSMTAKKPFTNPSIKGPREGGAVLPGDKFTTDWLHARELKQLGLAEPTDPAALNAEPTDAVQPTSAISAPELAAVNARRGKAGPAAPVAVVPLKPVVPVPPVAPLKV